MDKILGLLGLTRKAGGIQVGEQPVLEAVKSGHARLILLASDAAQNSVDRAAHAAAERAIPVIHTRYEKLTLGGSMGRASCAMAAVTDPGLALRLAEDLEPDNEALLAQLRAAAPRTQQQNGHRADRAKRGRV